MKTAANYWLFSSQTLDLSWIQNLTIMKCIHMNSSKSKVKKRECWKHELERKEEINLNQDLKNFLAV